MICERAVKDTLVVFTAALAGRVELHSGAVQPSGTILLVHFIGVITGCVADGARIILTSLQKRHSVVLVHTRC